MGSDTGISLISLILAWGAPVVLLAVVTIRFVRRRQRERRRSRGLNVRNTPVPAVDTSLFPADAAGFSAARPDPPADGRGGPMRRHDRAVTDPSRIAAIIASAKVCRLAIAVRDDPYLVTLSYGTDDRSPHASSAGAPPAGPQGGVPACLYFHCAREGRKLSMLRENPRVCFEITGRTEPVRGPNPCDWTMRYESLVGYGTVTEVTDMAEKRFGLETILRGHGATGPLDFPDEPLARTTVLRLDITELSCKSNWPDATPDGGQRG